MYKYLQFFNVHIAKYKKRNKEEEKKLKESVCVTCLKLKTREIEQY